MLFISTSSFRYMKSMKIVIIYILFVQFGRLYVCRLLLSVPNLRLFLSGAVYVTPLNVKPLRPYLVILIGLKEREMASLMMSRGPVADHDR